MKELLIILSIAIGSFLIGAISHENDMARNCIKFGDAYAWFNDIKCGETK